MARVGAENGLDRSSVAAPCPGGDCPFAEADGGGRLCYGPRDDERIERINGDLKNHGFGFLPVRGKLKAQAIALFHALANNMMATDRLRLLAT